MNLDSLTAESTALLQDLLRFNTTNPPGDETPCIEFIAEYLKRDGIDSVVLESAPGRGNLVARLKGDGSAAPFMLFGHVDVVPVEADKWQRAPFGGDLMDGVIWGRGATDMKHMVAMNLITFLQLKREGVPLKRDVIFMANADEETGGLMGAGWMVNQHPDLIRAEYALTEGGGALELDGRQFFQCNTGEKGAARFKLRGRGEPGHASMPHMRNPILPLAKALTKIIETPLPLHTTQTTRAYIAALSANVSPDLANTLRDVLDPAKHAEAVAALPVGQHIKRSLFAMFHNTTTPTILRAGSKINVIPAEAEAEVDCRVLPGITPEDIAREVHAVVGDEVEVEFGRFSPGIESNPQSPLFDLIQSAMRQHADGAIVVPGLIVGGTDARHVNRLGTKVYGFIPMKYEGPDMAALMHAHNERISVNNLMFGANMIHSIAREFCTRA